MKSGNMQLNTTRHVHMCTNKRVIMDKQDVAKMQQHEVMSQTATQHKQDIERFPANNMEQFQKNTMLDGTGSVSQV